MKTTLITTLLLSCMSAFGSNDDWPFLWGQNEGTIAGNTQYIIFGMALKSMLE